MFLHITGVQYLSEYKLRVWFNNGKVREVDLRNELYGEIFEPLKDQLLFQKVQVNRDTQTIEWPNGADFAPEFLFEVSKEIQVA